MDFIYTQSGHCIEYAVIMLLVLLIISIPVFALKIINLLFISKTDTGFILTDFERFLSDLSGEVVSAYLKFAQWAASVAVAIGIIGVLSRAFLMVVEK